LALLRAIDADESDTFGALDMQDFNGVAVEDGDDGAGEAIGKSRYAQRQHQTAFYIKSSKLSYSDQIPVPPGAQYRTYNGS